jgi:hypothetical protein
MVHLISNWKQEVFYDAYVSKRKASILSNRKCHMPNKKGESRSRVRAIIQIRKEAYFTHETAP